MRLIVIDPDWDDRALCKTIPLPEKQRLDLFFPDPPLGRPPVLTAQSQYVAAVEHAKSYCRRCTVSTDCLAYAISNGIRHGIWGGRSYRELRRLHKERAREEHIA